MFPLIPVVDPRTHKLHPQTGKVGRWPSGIDSSLDDALGIGQIAQIVHQSHYRGMNDVTASALTIEQLLDDRNTRPAGLRLAMMTLRLLENWRTHLGLDHDGALIVLATAAITMEKFTRVDFEPEHRDVRSAIPADMLTRCNVSSIAAATGLNRETTRRKVRTLVQDGMLIADERGFLRLSTDYTRSVQTSEMMACQLATLIQATNGLMRDNILVLS